MLTFADALSGADLKPASVRLLRHQDTRYPGYPSPYVLWRDNRPAFEQYQQTQSFKNASKLRAPYWAVFVGLPDKSTLFVGLYASRLKGPLSEDQVDPMTDRSSVLAPRTTMTWNCYPSCRNTPAAS
jgi:hypothetical protein